MVRRARATAAASADHDDPLTGATHQSFPGEDGKRTDPGAELAEAHHRFDQLAALTREAFVEIDSSAAVTEWNPRAEEILGGPVTR